MILDILSKKTLQLKEIVTCTTKKQFVKTVCKYQARPGMMQILFLLMIWQYDMVPQKLDSRCGFGFYLRTKAIVLVLVSTRKTVVLFIVEL